MTVRVALARLSAEGLIEAAERATYRLSATALELAGDVATWRTAEQRVRTWNGGYIAVFSADDFSLVEQCKLPSLVTTKGLTSIIAKSHSSNIFAKPK